MSGMNESIGTWNVLFSEQYTSMNKCSEAKFLYLRQSIYLKYSVITPEVYIETLTYRKLLSL